MNYVKNIISKHFRPTGLFFFFFFFVTNNNNKKKN